VFSANTEAALQRTLSSFEEYLTSHPETDLINLAWTLGARRSALPVKVALSASSIDELCNEISKKLENIQKTLGSSIGVRSVTGVRRILGVFTGQGAQWAR